jgi:hypothetical protein
LTFTAKKVVLVRPKYCTHEAKTLTVNVIAVVEKNPASGVEPVEWMF